MEQLRKYNPEFKHINDTLAFAVHLSFLEQDCKLIGIQDDQYLEDLGSIPQGWNRSHDLYTFKYVEKAESSKKEDKKSSAHKACILVRILQLGDNQLVISAVREGNDQIYTLDLHISDHIASTPASKEKAKEEEKKKEETQMDLSKYETIFKDVKGLLLLINERITFNVISKKEKESSKEEERDPLRVYREPARPPEYRPFDDPRRPGVIPYYDGINRPGRRPGDFDRDLNPFGGRGGFGGIPGGGGGLMGPNHPGFGRIGNRRPDTDDPTVPPGARFDPFGPGPLEKKPGPDPDHMRPPDNKRGGGTDPFF